jgi:hypothetical protein
MRVRRGEAAPPGGAVVGVVVALGLALAVGAVAVGMTNEDVESVRTVVIDAVYFGIAAVVVCASIACLPRRRPIARPGVTVTRRGITHVSRDGERADIPWPAIARVELSRATHVEPSPPWDAPPDDAEWIIVLDGGRTTRIPHQHVVHSALLDGLRANLGALDETALRAALDTFDPGSWTIFTRSSDR